MYYTFEHLLKFITEDQLLECLQLYEKRKMEACGLLVKYMEPKCGITKFEAHKILFKVQKEFK